MPSRNPAEQRVNGLTVLMANVHPGQGVPREDASGVKSLLAPSV